ncbi:MAG TPA: DUF790 family protein [Chloroflexota bacterium]|nr:DUF790 family protein [Chloroflexota bacterium]
MPFSLPDLKRSYGRGGFSGGPSDVRPYLLDGRELVKQRRRLQAVIDWHQAHCGRRRAEMDFDELAQVAGDYRLARCLHACLQATYRYEPPTFAGTMHELAADPGHVHALGIDSPSDLRLYVYDAVGSGYGGFVTPQTRATALAGPAQALGVSVEALDTLLWIDAEANHRLQQLAPPPTPEHLAASYNRRALATLLVRALGADLVLPAPDGSTIRRLYFLVKRHGLLCDLQLVEPRRGAAGGVQVHLFGPLEVFGPRTRHGNRFAAVLLILLRHFPGLQGTARVLLNEREYFLTLGPELATAIADGELSAEELDSEVEGEAPLDDAGLAGEASPEGEAAPPAVPLGPTAIVARAAAGEAFDSSVEARLFATLQGMERRGDTHGWRVEREPEPLIADTTVMVPDFAMTREQGRGAPPIRVFVEVIGFWTPAYRERKLDKLRRFAGQAQLVLVIQEGLVAHFDGLPFPILPYKQRISAVELIHLLQRHYRRAAGLQEEVRAELDVLLEALQPDLGLVSETELRRALELPPEFNLAQLQQPDGGQPPAPRAPARARGWRWVAGVGLCHEEWLAAFGERCAAVVAEGDGSAPLETIRDAVRASGLPAAPVAAERLELLLAATGYEVVWHSLFEATVRPQE